MGKQKVVVYVYRCPACGKTAENNKPGPIRWMHTSSSGIGSCPLSLKPMHPAEEKTYTI